MNDVDVRRFFSSFLFLMIVQSVQEFGVWIMQSRISAWFFALKTPSWNPPGSVFVIVWTILYIFIAFVGYLLWVKPPSKERSLALTFWSLQLVANGLWSYFFFHLKSPFFGFLDILAILFFTLLVMYYGRKVSMWVVYPFIPYAIWLAYAAALNLAIVLMNA